VEQLEEVILQAQAREAQIVEMSQWMSDVNDLLQTRLDADVLATDTPKEFEVHFIVHYLKHVRYTGCVTAISLFRLILVVSMIWHFLHLPKYFDGHEAIIIGTLIHIARQSVVWLYQVN
jgi:hypothetical protein